MCLGHLVRVPFGEQQAHGVVVRLDPAAPVPSTKPVLEVVHPDPVVTPLQLALAWWISHRYLAPLIDCLRLMFPPGLVRRAFVEYRIALDDPPAEAELSELDLAILDTLRAGGSLPAKQLGAALPGRRWRPALLRLVRRGWVTLRSITPPPRARPQFARFVRLLADAERIAAALPTLGRASRPSIALRWLADRPGQVVSRIELAAATGADSGTLHGLAKRGYVQLVDGHITIHRAASPSDIEAALQDLSAQAPRQAAALQAVLAAADNADPIAGRFSTNTWRALEVRGLIRRERADSGVRLRLTPDEARITALKLQGAERQRAVLDFLQAEGGPVDSSWVIAETGCTRNDLRLLAERGLIEIYEEDQWRDPLAGKSFSAPEPPVLTEAQARVWDVIRESIPCDRPRLERPETDGSEVEPGSPDGQPTLFLLHGVTGSGKTEIYLRAVAETLAAGRAAIVMVPEISLTPQTIHRFASRFPNRVAVVHSLLSMGERFDTWRRIRNGRLDVIIGARSALFAPVPHLGLIILDEEHDASYKQAVESAEEGPVVRLPSYHARDVAAELARLTGAVCLLGSATPDISSYYRAIQGRYRLLELPERVRAGIDHADLPPVRIVDLRQELRAGHRDIFSRPLLAALDQTLQRGEQAILFLNRRGRSTFVLCRDCGYVLQCPECDIPLTYHAEGHRLVCHTCNYHRRPPRKCPNCDSRRIRYFGLGTERVEEAVRQHFPEAIPLRWDRDTARGRGAHELLLRQFASGAANVLVGTQMIAKGLDLPRVTLVGIICADSGLALPDFLAGERTFQVLTQVAGRAGRAERPGQVILQTYQPDHYAIQSAARHDFRHFYDREALFRRQHRYPPFSSLARLVGSDYDLERIEVAGLELADKLRLALRRLGLPATDVLGPAPCFFARRKGRYRWQIIIRGPDPAALIRAVHLPPGWLVDVDPVSTL